VGPPFTNYNFCVEHILQYHFIEFAMAKIKRDEILTDFEEMSFIEFETYYFK